MEEKEKNYFEVLNGINVNDKVAKKKDLTYLSWAWAWAEVKKKYPNANYEIIKFNGLPYVYDELTGYMCYTKVSIEGITHEMWLPVLDVNNQAMKSQQYEVKTKYQTFIVKPATMFDINKTIMRCLTKNLAMFGLGLYIYAGEDLPEEESQTVSNANDYEITLKFSKIEDKCNNAAFLSKFGVSATSELNNAQKEQIINLYESKNGKIKL